MQPDPPQSGVTLLAVVAQEAGPSNAGLLHYFPSKKHLMVRLYSTLSGEAIDADHPDHPDHPFTASDQDGSCLITDADLEMTDMGDDVRLFVDEVRRSRQLPDPGPSPARKLGQRRPDVRRHVDRPSQRRHPPGVSDSVV